MKFRGRIKDFLAKRDFSNTINTLSKLGKHAVICLTPSTVSFIVFDEGAPRRPLAHCKLEQKKFFRDYEVFGVSKQYNQIWLEFSPDLLAKAISPLKSPMAIKCIKIKLSNKNVPCLTCEIESFADLKPSRVCTHDIPVEIIPRKNWKEFQLPPLPPIDLSIEMPNLKEFKSICDKMKFLNSELILEASPNGILVLKSDTDLASISTHFTRLNVLISPDGCHDDNQFEVKVDFKKLIGFLTIEQVYPANIIFSFVDKKLVLMEVVHDNVVLQYLIPGLLE